MKNILTGVCFILTTYCLVSCTKGGDQGGFSGNVYTISATASCKQLIPSIDTTSTGTLTGLYDEQANVLTYTITWTDLWRDSVYDAVQKKNVASTAAQKDTLSYINLYDLASATDTGILVRSQSATNANRSSSLALSLASSTGFTPTERADFYAGKWYIVLATKKYPKGIIRGQLIAVKK
jgi:hypothetical protein